MMQRDDLQTIGSQKSTVWAPESLLSYLHNQAEEERSSLEQAS